jgi:hypothetical protein
MFYSNKYKVQRYFATEAIKTKFHKTQMSIVWGKKKLINIFEGKSNQSCFNYQQWGNHYHLISFQDC